ncbi:IS3 family transposase, partial [Listeria monocytogenes]|uniref:IS3 family transposase n=1 Tax=Listeria monocytogenes TaxID=1639 RepID=UPI000A423E07
EKGRNEYYPPELKQEMIDKVLIHGCSIKTKQSNLTFNPGFVINHKRVQGLMKSMGLTARIRRKRKYASYKGEVGKKADNLIQRQFEGSKPYEKCYTDVTEFALPEGKLYLSPVLDGY